MTNSLPITTLFLDIGGVLLTNAWDRKIRMKAAELFKLDYAEMDERHHLTFDTYEEGKMDMDEYLNRVIFYEDRPFSREEFRAYMFAQSQPYPEMIAYIQALKAKYHLKIVVVSNEGRELTHHRVKTFELGKFVDFFIMSCFVHFRKPDPDLYRLALDVAQVAPEEIVYIEDRPMFVEVAQTLNIIGLHYIDVPTTKAVLDTFGLVLP
ncbi:MAG: HAD-IA family hydrolase [Anaerolineaceae bacterium]|nr:HAD-IA family hydrolase [Anaerolineaceae bacterium]